MRHSESSYFEGCFEEAINLAVQDIRTAARDLFDLHPGAREFIVTITDDGVIAVRFGGQGADPPCLGRDPNS